MHIPSAPFSHARQAASPSRKEHPTRPGAAPLSPYLPQILRKDQPAMAPIHEAAKHGNLSSVRQLVEREGVDATALDGNGQDDSDGEETDDDGDVPCAPAHYAAMRK